MLLNKHMSLNKCTAQHFLSDRRVRIVRLQFLFPQKRVRLLADGREGIFVLHFVWKFNLQRLCDGKVLQRNEPRCRSNRSRWVAEKTGQDWSLLIYTISQVVQITPHSLPFIPTWRSRAMTAAATTSRPSPRRSSCWPATGGGTPSTSGGRCTMR
jgi:hypothetical protein